MLKNRVLTAAILAPLVILAILFLPDQWFALFWGLAIALCAWEWTLLAGIEQKPARAIFVTLCIGAMTTYQQWGAEAEEWLAWPVVAWWFLLSLLIRKIPDKLVNFQYPPALRLILGLFILVTAWILMVWVQHNLGPWQTLYLFFLIWIADISAYFVGKSYGITKLSELISPNKTVEGLYGALAGSLIFSLIVAAVLYLTASGSFLEFNFIQLTDFVLLSLATVVISVVGDLFESLAKRVANVKDSGSILPGHGGLLDRLDSIIAAVSVYYAGSKLLEIFFR